jgi:hypothetical protein
MLTTTENSKLQAFRTVTIGGHALRIRIRRLSPRARAELARDLVIGRVQLKNLTRDQAAHIAGVSLPLVHDAVRGQRSPRLTPDSIASWWRSAPHNERVELVRNFGPADTWDALSAVVS